MVDVINNVIRITCALLLIIVAGAAASGWLLGVKERRDAIKRNSAVRAEMTDRIMGYVGDVDGLLDSNSSMPDTDAYVPPGDNAWSTVVEVDGTTADIIMRKGRMKRSARFQLVGNTLTIAHVVPTTGLTRYPLELAWPDVITVLRTIKENSDI